MVLRDNHHTRAKPKSERLPELLPADLSSYASALNIDGIGVHELAQLTLADLKELLPSAPIGDRLRLLGLLRTAATSAEEPAEGRLPFELTGARRLLD